MCRLRVPREIHLWITSEEMFRLRWSATWKATARLSWQQQSVLLLRLGRYVFMSASSPRLSPETLWMERIRRDVQGEPPVIWDTSLHCPESPVGCKYWSALTFNIKTKHIFLSHDSIWPISREVWISPFFLNWRFALSKLGRHSDQRSIFSEQSFLWPTVFFRSLF